MGGSSGGMREGCGGMGRMAGMGGANWVDKIVGQKPVP